jgi:2-(1,2-epoxy-1,2-dihydrophenyl)acetyl-CoA isomerase
MRTVITSVSDGIGRVVLNRPEVGNAINMVLAEDLFAALTQLHVDADVRCLVLEANGPIFCAGGDLADFGGDGAGDMSSRIHALATALHRSIELIEAMDKPLVTAIQGTAAGAGVVLGACADLVLVSDQAKFVPAYGRVGLTPDGGSTWYLPRLMGDRRATEMLLTGGALSAAEAVETGLVTRLVPHDSLATKTTTVALRLADSTGMSVGETRRLVRTGRNASLHDHLLEEAQSISRASEHPGAREAIGAFLARTRT